MIVNEATEYYLIHSMGLTKQQIKDMLPSEIHKYCEEITRREIDALGVYKKPSETNNSETLR
jgi:putative aminopeptidase FrvX